MDSFIIIKEKNGEGKIKYSIIFIIHFVFGRQKIVQEGKKLVFACGFI